MRRWIACFFATTTLGGGALYGADQAVNPYDDKGTHYELDIKSDIEQGERVEIAKDKAAMTLKGWNDEYAITITPQIPTPLFGTAKDVDRSFKTQSDRPLLSKKIEFREGNVTAFIEPKEGTENEFDIDFTLHSKPDTNVFEYKIEGAEDFDFFYQPKLTPEEIAEGAERPENVIGSYAVYHKTKANHHLGDTNYATGKAFHIYRPKAIDANRTEVWADLTYADGVLSVTVPQEWLQRATYPVRVDPTFGKTAIGATNTMFPPDASKVASLFTHTETGDVTMITAYYAGSGTTDVQHFAGNVRTVIYNVSASEPNALLVTSPEVSIPDEINAWYDFTLSSPLNLSAASYYLGAHSANVKRGRADTAGTNRFNADTYADGAADPFGSPTSSSLQRSIYATYTTAGNTPVYITPSTVIDRASVFIDGASVIIN